MINAWEETYNQSWSGNQKIRFAHLMCLSSGSPSLLPDSL
jgi:hypothetical protein